MIKVPDKVSGPNQILALDDQYHYLGHRLRKVKYMLQSIHDTRRTLYRLEHENFPFDKVAVERYLDVLEKALVELYNSSRG